MNNPQHYQPLSHALQPFPASSSNTQPVYDSSHMYNSKRQDEYSHSNREEEEEEEDDPDDGDEGLVEEQLNRNEPDLQGNHTPPAPVSSNGNLQTAQNTQQGQQNVQEPERKRRPGRPRGSKNRKPRVANQGTTKPDAYLSHPPNTQPLATAQHPDVNSENKQFYEFQWRILNLCAEFYGAAEELVKGTSGHVLAQCYQSAPTGNNDPIKMLVEAKRVCDALLANPSQFALNPTNPSYSNSQHVSTAQGTSIQSSPSASGSTNKAPTTPTTVITNPQSFVVSLGAQAPYPHAQYPYFPPTAAQYPTAYYHHLSYAPPPGTAFYPQPPQVLAPQTQGAATTSVSSPMTTTPGTLTSIPSSGVLNQGAWSEEETEKLRKLAEESRSIGSSGEIEWDWVVNQYGNGRTRHQILIKATSLGLKESSSRGLKRRRDAEDDVSPSTAPPPPRPSSSSNVNTVANGSAQPSASPAQSHATSTPLDSPAMQNQRPSTSKGSTTSSAPSNLPWPMPTVAVNTPSPVITSSTVGQDQQRPAYYRLRPSQDATKTLSHHFMYQPNGNNITGSRFSKENGK
ncbi:hypothetical protein AMATHDRAFT_55634 [Amanita thiersii Skay4041]|uniref:Myb-like domain-containing protein n=1 Tax=Amanita thiersii Skay4041 TaxID=703135 RepID=A0A2A9NQC1_9AGAR|nr:hypothetical protein AMATHDRAFT_55634 [Amanita thiersii Skay4041]